MTLGKGRNGETSQKLLRKVSAWTRVGSARGRGVINVDVFSVNMICFQIGYGKKEREIKDDSKIWGPGNRRMELPFTRQGRLKDEQREWWWGIS